MPPGVSVVVCCHNSAQRLPQTLAHLAAQQVQGGLQWEVIVVDNNSADETSQVALTRWPSDAPAPLRVVPEPKLGLSHARYRGYTEANYECISFLDDDNWASPEWVQLTSELMGQYPVIGACGGFNEAVCEVSPPWWFERYKKFYAIGPQGQEAGEITWTRGFLWGAGLTIRKSAWQQLVGKGFRSVLVDRQGASLSSGGDSEFCFALRLADWRLWYEPSLNLRHFLPANRLEWSYLRRLCRGLGASSVGHDPYLWALRRGPKNFRERVRQTWQWQTLKVLKMLLWHHRKLLLSFCYPLEGDSDILTIESQIGRLCGLVGKRKAYDSIIQEIRQAPWRKIQ